MPDKNEFQGNYCSFFKAVMLRHSQAIRLQLCIDSRTVLNGIIAGTHPLLSDYPVLPLVSLG